MKLKIFCSMLLLSVTSLPTLSHSARWWQPNPHKYDGSGIDLDSYRVFTDNEGYEITSMWFRGKMNKAKSIYNPALGRNSITSAFSTLIQVRCETGEIKFTELILQDRQYKTLWKASQYPDYANDLEAPINHFYYPNPSSQEGEIAENLCKFRALEQEHGFSIKDLQLDEYGHAVQH